MAKIYLPTEYVNKDCKVVYNDYIRVYDNNSYTSWTDIYFKSSYYLKNGQTNFTNNVICDNVNIYTDNIFYRYDNSSNLISFFIILLICFYFPYKIISRMFGRWLRI